jgi:transketolase
MRTAFIQSLMAHARIDPRLFLVVGDLGYSVVEQFAAEFPDRFLNAGVAEQNMMGIAAGLAFEGYHVFTYSIANFPTLRCLEQVRNDICYHGLPVTVVSVGAGFAYGNLGYSHHAVQDIAVMRTLPHMRIYSPADPRETHRCVDALVETPGPSYLRIGKSGEEVLYAGISQERIEVDRAPVAVRDGHGAIAIAATGSILKVAIEAADELRGVGIDAAVFSCPRLSLLHEAFFEPLWRYRNVVTLEEHVLAGGLGSILREQSPEGVRIQSLAVDQHTAGSVGGQEFLRSQHGLTVPRVAALCRALMSADES